MALLARSHAPRGEYDAAFWIARGFGPEPTNREKFLALTIDELSETGPHSFNATLICDLLGTTYPMVNHYFGSRNGLIAEAVARAYGDYVASLRQAAERGETPGARLESWVRRQISWTSEHAGISVIIDFPESSLEVTTELRARFQDEMASRFSFNMGVLVHLVGDVQRGAITPITFDEHTVPFGLVSGNLSLVKRASSIGLATMGAAIWMSGSHAAGGHIADSIIDREAIVEAHVGMLLRAAAASLDL
ncbi:MAG TPA: hypothetical protein VK139_04585 [Microbacteriaceae bacterium]|nr:hypothetical protein [Microbacteriaceae bacterium]